MSKPNTPEQRKAMAAIIAVAERKVYWEGGAFGGVFTELNNGDFLHVSPTGQIEILKKPLTLRGPKI